MKKVTTLAVLSLVALVFVHAALAQDVALKADVPFRFHVGNTAMPAGAYTVTEVYRGLIRISNDDRNIATTVATTHDFNDPGSSSKFVFEKIGDQYFLHRVDCPAVVSMNVDIPTWGAEKRARREAKVERGEEILVAAR